MRSNRTSSKQHTERESEGINEQANKQEKKKLSIKKGLWEKRGKDPLEMVGWQDGSNYDHDILLLAMIQYLMTCHHQLGALEVTICPAFDRQTPPPCAPLGAHGASDFSLLTRSIARQ